MREPLGLSVGLLIRSSTWATESQETNYLWSYTYSPWYLSAANFFLQTVKVNPFAKKSVAGNAAIP